MKYFITTKSYVILIRFSYLCSINMSKKVSLQMVAEKLGLSKTLVSLVLNGKGDEHKISKETQKKVIAIVKKLNYQPNRFARSLRTGKTNIIGLVIPDISNSFYSVIAKTIEEIVSKRGYHLIVCNTNEEEKKESNLIDTLLNWNVDGLIVASCFASSKNYDKINKSGKPLILIDRTFRDKKFVSITVENKLGAQLMVKHLVDLGKKHIAMITFSNSLISPITERKDGFVEACKRNAKSIAFYKIIEVDFDNMKDEIKKIIQDIYLKKIFADAIFTVNNVLALAAYSCMKELKLNHNLTLCSFDDIPIFEHFSPPITAIAQPVERIGVESAKLLLQALDEKKTSETRITLPVNLIIR